MVCSLEFDKHNVALTSLEMLLYCLKSVEAKKSYWQWIYISLHAAVQAYMVLALSGSNPLLLYRKDDAEEWLRKCDNHESLPTYKLDFFINLYRKIESDDFLLYRTSQRFVPTPSQDRSIAELNDRRNDVVHFTHGGLIIIMSDHPYQMVIDCLDFVDFLAFQSNNIFWGDEYYKDETKRLLNECKSIINSSSPSRG